MQLISVLTSHVLMHMQKWSLLVKALNCQDYSTELHFLDTNYGDDVDIGVLNDQLEIFKVLLKEW